MDKLALLSGDAYSDDHVLETDIMRFLAIIGIVFWIVFALVKSIPFEIPEAKLTEVVPVKSKTMPVAQSPVETVAEETASSRVVHQPQEATVKVAEPAPSKNLEEAKEQKSPAPLQIGIRIQFASLEDLMALLKVQKVEIYGRAQARGFDLFFAGYPEDDTIVFKGERKFPEKLWEIKSGRDYEYFLTLLSKTYPAIRSFPTKQVLISFADGELEKRFETAVSRLEREEKNGVLSVTKSGEVTFQEFSRMTDKRTDGDKGEKQ